VYLNALDASYIHETCPPSLVRFRPTLLVCILTSNRILPVACMPKQLDASAHSLLVLFVVCGMYLGILALAECSGVDALRAACIVSDVQ
jgi:hypothetical protein